MPPVLTAVTDPVERFPVERFIERWSPSGGAELANYGLFISELCDLIGVPRPDPRTGDDARDSYVLEKPVTIRHTDDSTSSGRIDCYRKDCFVLEAKQGVDAESQTALPLLGVAGAPAAPSGTRRRGHGVRGSKGWDDAMIRARGQAEKYAKALPEWPPFLIVLDVGHEIQLFAGFSRTGKDYTHFPDASSFRIRMTDLRRQETRDLLKAVWLDPLSLDPSKRTAKVTREIAERLAVLAKSLEQAGHSAANVATFLMRCLFTMFAEDVELLPKDSFRDLLRNLRGHPQDFVPTMRVLWKSMNDGDFCGVLTQKVLRFNGGLFKHADALPLTPEQLELLIQAAEANWRDVEPAIFGTLLERALDKTERHKLGAHYTPRAYVERLVLPTVIEPLREEWEAVKVAAAEQERDAAVALVMEFHRKLCDTRVLDPACGTGNFLYVTMELMKKLEGEVLDFLSITLDVRQDALDLAGHTVDPHQFLGIEVNPRAAAIAELVLWIGYLQWHFKTRGKVMPAEPVLKDFKNIENRDAILAWDRTEIVRDESGRPVTRWDGVTMKKHPVTGEDVPDETARVELVRYVKPRPAKWPKADYIVGNPPFIGTKLMRAALGDGYVNQLRETIDHIPDSADYVMYWWDHAAKLLWNGKIFRFGFVTTNSITQTFNRRVLTNRLKTGAQIYIIFAIPDHPWSDADGSAAVRISMTVVAKGNSAGRLLLPIREEHLGSETPNIEFNEKHGAISADLRIGANIGNATELISNERICGFGMALHGQGFLLSRAKSDELKKFGSQVIRPFLGGKDLLSAARERYVIDFSGLTEEEAQIANPAAFQHVMLYVKPERDHNRRDSIKKLWWRFAWERPTLREALKGLDRYIATTETSKHRVFQFIEAIYLTDHMGIVISSQDALILGALSSWPHRLWAIKAGGTLEDRPRYNKTRCFDPFPFPDPAEELKARIRVLGERLDSFRKERQAAHPDLTLTQMYNVLERLRELDRDPAAKPLDAKEKAIHEKGLISVLRQIHDDLDRAVFDAYGWPHDLTDEQILERLVALNKERAAEEKRGIIRWLRPEFQAPKTARPVQTAMEVGPEETSAPAAPAAKAPWPKSLPEQAQQVLAALTALGRPATPTEVARTFRSAPAPRVAEVMATLETMGRAWKVENTDRYAA
ncbi:class I SAM-dependent DNA methyltransferase [Rhodospirillum centenum]|nr:class I SAM-dependent DNA methyltransferase [Rhodospirillum centenum]